MKNCKKLFLFLSPPQLNNLWGHLYIYPKAVYPGVARTKKKGLVTHPIFSKRGKGLLQGYLVTWKGWDVKEAEWVGLDGLAGAARAMAEFERRESQGAK